MEETYQIHENFLYLENKIFRGMDQIKQLRIYPPENGKCKVIVVYEIAEPEQTFAEWTLSYLLIWDFIIL